MGAFPETPWTIVLQATRLSEPLGADALRDLCCQYREPIVGYLKVLGWSREDAEDITQDFFVQVCEGKFLSSVDRSKGRLRGFLRTTLRNFAGNHRRSLSAKKRGGDRLHVELDETRESGGLGEEGLPEQAFDRAWAEQLLGRALLGLEAEYRDRGRGEAFAVLRETLTWGEHGSQAASAKKLGMTAGAYRVAVHTLRRRYRERIEKELLKTVDSWGSLREEVVYLFRLFGS